MSSPAAAPREGPYRCTWTPGAPASSCPHPLGRSKRPLIGDSILDFIGDTPMVRLHRVSASLAATGIELVAKCEFMSVGGSVKDRIGRRMVADAEASGRIKPGDTLIEPTSGNTGIGIALAAAVKGYRCIITLPEKMSQEKVDVLRALGAEIVRTPTEAAWDAPESHIGVARRLERELERAHILDQYANPSNPMAHYCTTAEEIWEQCEGRVDMVVVAAGTGGTLTGIARRLKELNPAVLIVGVDPKGSILAQPDALNDERRLQSYAVEGIGYDFIPAVLDRALVDRWVKTDDRASLVMARRLIREEGLLCGGSSGAAVEGALEAAKVLRAGQRCVVLLPDSIRNYMTKHLSDDWMWRQGFAAPELGIGKADAALADAAAEWWARRPVGDLGLHSPVTIAPTVSVSEAVDILQSLGFDMLPVVDEENAVLGVVTEAHMAARLISGRLKAKDSVSRALYTQFRTVGVTTPLAELARFFDKDAFAVVTQLQRTYASGKECRDRSVVVGVVTRIDLLKFISSAGPAGPAATPSTPGRIAAAP